MLEDAINTLSGSLVQNKQEIDIKLEISAFISDDIIDHERVRLELYRRLSRVESISEIYEIEAEMIDRFGALDTPTKQFLNLIEIKTMALAKSIKQISNYSNNITIVFNNNDKKSIKSFSKDDDDLIKATTQYLRSLKSASL